MALGKKKSKGKGKGKKNNENRRYFASVWQNEGKHGDFLKLSVDNNDPSEEEYFKGKLIYFDAETETYYEVKSANIIEATKGPKNLLNKLYIDLDDEYHVDEMD